MKTQSRSSWRTGTNLAEPHDLILAARSIIAARQVFAAQMPAGFTGDPAPVILLHLFLEGEADRTPTLSTVVAQTRLASPAVARWCKVLEHQGLIRFGVAVSLTDQGINLVTDMLTAVITAQAQLLGMPPV